MPAARNKRRGLHKLTCDCGAGVYATWAQLETHGLPVCGHCSVPFSPDDFEIAGALGIDCPALAEYQHELERIAHGQAPHGRRGRELRPAEELAAERVERRRREVAHAARIAPLRHAPANAGAHGDFIPF